MSVTSTSNAGSAEGSDSVVVSDELTRRIFGCVRRLLPRAQARKDILPTDRLRWELGLDSMKLLELVFLLEEEFEWHLDESDFGTRPVETVRELIEIVRALQARRDA